MPAPVILTFTLDHWPQTSGPQTRASRPKVRTGCITCKYVKSTGLDAEYRSFRIKDLQPPRRRRVKCDETKPACQNCMKRRISCEGYMPGGKMDVSQKQVARLYQSSSSPLSVEPSYQGLVFTTQLQKDFFDHWLSFAKDALTFPSELINMVIPQIAHSDAAVKNAAFAIGATAFGNSTREQRLKGQSPYHAESLEYYTRALQLTMQSPATEETIPRILMTCLMFVMLEALKGDRKATLTHLNHGVNVLDQYERRFGNARDPLVKAIVANFQRLTLHSWTHNGAHPTETKKHVPWCCRGQTKRYAVDEMPDTFETLDEAHRWWEITQHYAIHHAPLIIGFRVEGAGNKAPGAFPPNKSLPISPEQVKAHASFVDRWRDRFLPLIEATRRQKTPEREYLKALGLRIHSIYLSIPIKTANYEDPIALAAMTPSFREFITLSEEFLQMQHLQMSMKGEVFTMDSISPTWPLGAASLLCMDEDARLHAQRLMRDYPRRDGLWDTHAFLSMLQNFPGAVQVINSRLGEEQSQHQFDFELVYEEKSVVWVKQVEDPTVFTRDDLEYRVELI
ncbi:putative transcriptional regulatory protein C15D4.02-like protein 2 [Colletotrichum chlorophyti]|uniref:Putative transcriptional regulatory protein C15D4.02-like protein 2 n=1 Tax=Colletotrichum chlorophyti TaxID=708187 RepID=A0A1Q8RB51_9PEZI|nr:putative transcriptional regulatory protein C15D4.02-like protein 2 [Colletotrichum chlorophyti]